MGTTPRRRGSLQPSDFIAGAKAVAKRHGLAHVSLRTIASELAISHMALYKHYPNKESLVDAMIDDVMGGIDRPPFDAADWASWVERTSLEVLNVLDEVPGLADEVLDRFPHRLTPNGVALTDSFITALQAAGLDRNTAGTAFLVVWAYIAGALTLRARPRQHPDTDSTLPPSLHGGLDNSEFLIGLRLIVYGIEARAPHHHTTPRTRTR